MKTRSSAGFIAAWALYSHQAQAAVAGPEKPLRDRHEALGAQLADRLLQQGLHLESSEIPRGLRGAIYAIVAFPFATYQRCLREVCKP
jgi:hypothetical protein